MTKKQLFALSGSSADTKKGSEHPFEFELTDDKGKPLGVFFSVIGSNSQAVRNFQSKVLRDEQARELKAQRTGKKDFRDLDDYEGLAVESAVVRCVGWKNVSVDGEAELEFNSENARMVFERFVPVREQVIEASDDLGNFRPA